MSHPAPAAQFLGRCAFVLLAWGSTCAAAGGLDRTAQSLSPLFEKGRYVGVDGYYSRPSVQGRDAMGFSTGDVAPSYGQWGLSYKQDLSPQLSMALMLTRPFGLHIRYDRSASPLLGGTEVKLSTRELQGVLRYKFNAQWGVHGGLRLQQSHGSVTLQGMAYGAALGGYHVKFARSTEPGYLLGISYEQPDIALRVVATYYSAIRHRVQTTENLWPGSTQTASTSPQTFNLDVQTGITASALLFGQIRWGNWEAFELRPQAFATITRGKSLTDLDNAITYTLGLAQKFSPQWTGFVALAHDKKSPSMPLSPLRPSSGRQGYTLGLVYDNEVVKISPWVSYQRLGGAEVSTTQTPMARFGKSSATVFGIQMGYHF
ncbi:OmpP1/FadL family transporter [Comamonas jiangduensis]|uniref:OmpP1/FadL family transporter n=1 Tax=Comamonas jiangduensis TaxID=1194168 RepID=UPI003BF7D2DC